MKLKARQRHTLSANTLKRKVMGKNIKRQQPEVKTFQDASFLTGLTEKELIQLAELHHIDAIRHRGWFYFTTDAIKDWQEEFCLEVKSRAESERKAFEATSKRYNNLKSNGYGY
jgi:hypothetical protein